MKKYYVIQNLATGGYLRAATTDDFSCTIFDCGKWGELEDAELWIESCPSKIYITIFPVYLKF